MTISKMTTRLLFAFSMTKSTNEYLGLSMEPFNGYSELIVVNRHSPSSTTGFVVDFIFLWVLPEFWAITIIFPLSFDFEIDKHIYNALWCPVSHFNNLFIFSPKITLKHNLKKTSQSFQLFKIYKTTIEIIPRVFPSAYVHHMISMKLHQLLRKRIITKFSWSATSPSKSMPAFLEILINSWFEIFLKLV